MNQSPPLPPQWSSNPSKTCLAATLHPSHQSAGLKLALKERVPTARPGPGLRVFRGERAQRPATLPCPPGPGDLTLAKPQTSVWWWLGLHVVVPHPLLQLLALHPHVYHGVPDQGNWVLPTLTASREWGHSCSLQGRGSQVGRAVARCGRQDKLEQRKGIGKQQVQGKAGAAQRLPGPRPSLSGPLPPLVNKEQLCSHLVQGLSARSLPAPC